jgi:aspartyl-tRNA(Asn)/glutamyl-tRNA(Gln) amidotransferase subunit C
MLVGAIAAAAMLPASASAHVPTAAPLVERHRPILRYDSDERRRGAGVRVGPAGPHVAEGAHDHPRRAGRGRGAARRPALLQSAAMIDRDQVLHVARLARLRLSDEELERMPAELSKILEHVERMNRLDLEGVPPTSHVVELQNVVREDVPRPSLPREKALRGAPDVAGGGFRVPSPGAS